VSLPTIGSIRFDVDRGDDACAGEDEREIACARVLSLDDAVEFDAASSGGYEECRLKRRL
jgi:hypothetical protein